MELQLSQINQIAQVQKYLNQKAKQYSEYHSLIETLEKLKNQIPEETKLKQQAYQEISLFFEPRKKALWQDINKRKGELLKGNSPERVQQLINQIPHRCNRLCQNAIRVTKQTNSQNKLELVNPFIGSSLLYKVQNTIQDAEVKSDRDTKRTYLELVVDLASYKQSLHTYVYELSEQTINSWLNKEWQSILESYDGRGLKQLEGEIVELLQPLSNIAPVRLQQPNLYPALNLDKYVELPALRQNSRIVFDYNYTQSTWFRLLMAVVVGGIIYLTTTRLFGFILLLVQIINLLTGQDMKKIRLRQQTKELKRIVDSRYQFFIRFLSDKATQEIAIALDNIAQSYQEQIESITSQASQELHHIKQANQKTREQIDRLKQDQRKIQSILE